MRAWLGGVGAAALLLLGGACADPDGDETQPPVVERPGADGGLPDAGSAPDAGAVRAGWTYGDEAADEAGPVAHDARTGDLLLVLRLGRGALPETPEAEREQLRLLRRSAQGATVWTRSLQVFSASFPLEERRASSRGVAFTPDGGAWALLSWRGGNVDLGAGSLVAGDSLVRLSATGSIQHVRHLVSGRGIALTEGLAVDAAGSARLLVQGVPGTDFGSGPAQGTPPAPTYLVRMDLDGGQVWTRELPQWLPLDVLDVGAPHLALAGDGTAWVLGTFATPWSAGDVQLTPVGSTDVYLLEVGP